MEKITCCGKTYPTRRIFCIGMNYREHILELGSKEPSEPVIFMKPSTCLVPPGEKVIFPVAGKDLHYEAEMVLLIGKEGKPRHIDESLQFVSGISLGFDLTLRDVQNRLKNAGLPWEACKAFDQSSPLGNFTPASEINPDDFYFYARKNGQIVQKGSTSDMIFPVSSLIWSISQSWKLLPGDLIYTGTPPGVGSLAPGDTIEVGSEQTGDFSWNIVHS